MFSDDLISYGYYDIAFLFCAVYNFVIRPLEILGSLDLRLENVFPTFLNAGELILCGKFQRLSFLVRGVSFIFYLQ